ncbi:MAG: hypothetical protein ABI414_14565 [Devosia sp.]
MRLRTAWAVVALATLSTAALAQEVIDADFLVSSTNAAGEQVVQSTRVVPNTEGACYAWRLRLGKTKTAVEVTEVLRLPSAPENWGGSDPSEISSNGLNATTALSLVPEDGWITHGWCVAAGDPTGRYRIEVSSATKSLQVFGFELRAP